MFFKKIWFSKCCNKGLNFEEELAKFNLKIENDKINKQEKERLLKEKQDAKEINLKENLEKKFNSLSDEKKKLLLEKKNKQEEKLNKFWEKESQEGLVVYRNFQKELLNNEN